MALALRGSRRQGRPGASCQAQCRGLRRAGRRGVQCHLAARRPGRSGRPGWAGEHQRARRRGAAGVRVKRCPRLCAPRSPPARPGPRVPAAGKEQEVWGRHTHANPAWEAGRPHPAPPPPRLPRAPAPGAQPLPHRARARLHPQNAQRATRRPPGSSALSRRLPTGTALHFGALHPQRSPARPACGPRVAEHTGNLATVTLRQPRPAENRLAPGCALSSSP